MLEHLYEHITEPLQSSIEEIMVADAYFNYSQEIHYELLEAIKKQDVQAAISYVNTYINVFREKIKRIQED